MIEVICICDNIAPGRQKKLKQGEIYYTEEDYYLLDNIDIIWIDEKTIAGVYITIGVYQKKYFMTLAEYREKQIKSVLDD